MQRLTDVSSIQRVLRSAVERGLFTLEDLDTPSLGFKRCADTGFNSLTPKAKSSGETRNRFFPLGCEGVQHRNLLREEIQTHPETVQAQPDPRDFVPSAATAAQQLEPDPCPF